MKTRVLFVLALLGVGAAIQSVHGADKIVSDVVTPDKRRAVVETATQLAKPPIVQPLPPQIPNPFDPAGFGQPDAAELAAERAAQQKSQKTQAARAPNDHDLLERLASKLVATGSLVGRDGQPILYFGKTPVKIGDKFKVKDSDIEYPLELTAIDRTTFTLRFNREEIIRPIKPGK